MRSRRCARARRGPRRGRRHAPRPAPSRRRSGRGGCTSRCRSARCARSRPRRRPRERRQTTRCSKRHVEVLSPPWSFVARVLIVRILYPFSFKSSKLYLYNIRVYRCARTCSCCCMINVNVFRECFDCCLSIREVVRSLELAIIFFNRLDSLFL